MSLLFQPPYRKAFNSSRYSIPDQATPVGLSLLLPPTYYPEHFPDKPRRIILSR
jgi:hypothetical protein